MHTGESRGRKATDVADKRQVTCVISEVPAGADGTGQGLQATETFGVP